MRTAVVQVDDAAGDIDLQMIKSLCRVFPRAELIRLPTLPDGTVPTTFPLRGRPKRFPQGSIAKPHRSLGGWLSDGQCQLTGYDLVLTAGPEAARLVAVPDETLHVCYLTSSSDASSQTPQGMVHFVAASQSIRDRFEPYLAKPCPVLYPPIDTTYFRPGPEAREAFYLLICEGITAPLVQLAIEGCRAARRELLILGWDGREKLSLGRNPRMRSRKAASHAGRREGYRSCRGVIVPAESGFDPILIEAQACGAPVIAYHGGGAIETVIDAECAGMGTGIFFHEQTSAGISSAIGELERRPQKLSPALAWAHATQFSPARFEQELRWYIERLMEGRGAGNAPEKEAALTLRVRAA